MARVTVEDCLHDMENLFQLVLVASKRTRQIYAGSDPKVPVDGDKPTVISLREIAAGKVGTEVLDQKMPVGMEFDDADDNESEAVSAASMPTPPEI